MNSQEIYKKETGLSAYDILDFNETIMVPTNEYLEWLEKTVENRYEPTILLWIKEMFVHAEKKQWNKVYFNIDLHGTVSKPDYRRDTKCIDYYPYAKETLQLLTQREDISLILWSSSYPDELEIYEKQFKQDNIKFDFVGENPDVSTEKGSFGYYKNKHYFNALFEDKAGLNAERDWKFLYEFFLNQTYRPKLEWSMKYKEDYHK